MTIVYIGCAILLAYLLGSIPSAVWYGQRMYGIDVRQYGSGNAGATNTFRVLGKRAGIIVLLLDMLKGAAATSLARVLLQQDIIPADRLVEFQLLLGIVAVAGHIFPVFTKFDGGKGVATLSGMVLIITTSLPNRRTSACCFRLCHVCLIGSHPSEKYSAIA
mgnify:CR=1 FL=1